MGCLSHTSEKAELSRAVRRLRGRLVPPTGLEPVRDAKFSADFKSDVSTYSTTAACRKKEKYEVERCEIVCLNLIFTL